MTIPPLERTIDLRSTVAYAGATWDWHRLHYDIDNATRSGLQAPVVDGQMLGALMATQLTAHFGPQAFIRELSFRFRAMVFAGQTVRCEAEVVDSSVSDDVLTTHRVLVGDRLVADGAATVRLAIARRDAS